MKRILFLLSLLILMAGTTACWSKPDPTPVGTLLSSAVKLEVAENGVYQVTVEELQEVGITVENLTEDNVHLSEAGTAVPYHIQNGALLFYGQAPTSRYTAVRPYLLEIGKEGVLMQETAVSATASNKLTQIPLTVHLEENSRYEASTLTHVPADQLDLNTADPWFWDKLSSNFALPISLDLPQVADGSATVTINIWGDSNNPKINLDHDVDLVVNGQRVGTTQWEGLQFHTGEFTIPANTLEQGTNELIIDNEIDGASFVDIQMLNWLDIHYQSPPIAINDSLTFGNVAGELTLSGFSQTPLIVDISTPGTPTIMTGWEATDDGGQLALEESLVVTAVAPQGYKTASILSVRQSNWQDNNHQADLIIITPDAFSEAMTPLVQAREEQGLTVAIVPLAEIYDEFGYGAATPTSIQTFIQYAHGNWQSPQPAYILLVGDATSDYRNYLGENTPNLLPSLMVPVQFSGETVSDARLADINADKIPDIAIGRWPANQIQEVESLVERTLDYENGTAADRAIFATDSTETQFAHIAQRLSDNTSLTSDFYDGSTATEIANQFNKGAWLATYIGHGSVRRWGREDVFNLDTISELNSSTPPITVQLTCLTGLFSAPTTSLSEAMILHDSGPVLIIAATSLTLSSHQEPFAETLFQSLQDSDIERMGDALQAAKQGLDVSSNGLREISDTFILLGDPSSLILRPS